MNVNLLHMVDVVVVALCSASRLFMSLHGIIYPITCTVLSLFITLCDLFLLQVYRITDNWTRNLCFNFTKFEVRCGLFLTYTVAVWVSNLCQFLNLFPRFPEIVDGENRFQSDPKSLLVCNQEPCIREMLSNVIMLVFSWLICILFLLAKNWVCHQNAKYFGGKEA